jgi:hypothetical protein
MNRSDLIAAMSHGLNARDSEIKSTIKFEQTLGIFWIYAL